MTDAIQIAAALIICTLTAALLTTLTMWAWTRFWTWTSRTIATHIDRALSNQRTHHDIDAEYRALVLAEHNGDNL